MAAVAVLLSALGCGRLGYETSVQTDDGEAPPLEDAAQGDRPGPLLDAGDASASDSAPAPDGAPPRIDGGAEAGGPPPSDATVPPDSSPPPPDSSPPPPDAAPPPAAVTINGENPTATEGWTSAGTPYRDLCPAGEAVIGYHGFQAQSPTMPWMRSLQTQCGRLSVGAGPSYPITTSSGTLLPLRGLEGGTAWTRLCPANQVVVGFGGRSSGYLDQLVVRCAPLWVTGAPGSQTVTVGSITSLPPTDSRAGTEFPPIDCPAGQIAAGSNVTADNYPRSFGLFCGTPSVN